MNDSVQNGEALSSAKKSRGHAHRPGENCQSSPIQKSGKKPGKKIKSYTNADAQVLALLGHLAETKIITLGGIFGSPENRQSPKSSNDPNALLNVAEAAATLALSPKTLANWRVSGAGPRFCKIGGRVLYRTSDLKAFVAANLRRSTSDSGER
jgi:hypothetical protein